MSKWKLKIAQVHLLLLCLTLSQNLEKHMPVAEKTFNDPTNAAITALINLGGTKDKQSNSSTTTATTNSNPAAADALTQLLHSQMAGTTPEGSAELLKAIFSQGMESVPGLATTYAQAAGARSSSNSPFMLALQDMMLKLTREGAMQMRANSDSASQTAGRLADTSKTQTQTQTQTATNTKSPKASALQAAPFLLANLAKLKALGGGAIDGIEKLFGSSDAGSAGAPFFGITPSESGAIPSNFDSASPDFGFNSSNFISSSALSEVPGTSGAGGFGAPITQMDSPAGAPAPLAPTSDQSSSPQFDPSAGGIDFSSLGGDTFADFGNVTPDLSDAIFNSTNVDDVFSGFEGASNFFGFNKGGYVTRDPKKSMAKYKPGGYAEGGEVTPNGGVATTPTTTDVTQNLLGSQGQQLRGITYNDVSADPMLLAAGLAKPDDAEAVAALNTADSAASATNSPMPGIGMADDAPSLPSRYQTIHDELLPQFSNQPAKFFNEKSYLAANKDVADQVAAGNATAYGYYKAFGEKEGRSLGTVDFDEDGFNRALSDRILPSVLPGVDASKLLYNSNGTVSWRDSPNATEMPLSYFKDGGFDSDVSRYTVAQGPGGIFNPSGKTYDGPGFKPHDDGDYSGDDLYQQDDTGKVIGFSQTEQGRRNVIDNAYHAMLDGDSTTTDFSNFGRPPAKLGSDVMLGLASAGAWSPRGGDNSGRNRNIEARMDQNGNILVTDPRGGDGANPIYIYGPDGKFQRAQVGSKAMSPAQGVGQVIGSALTFGALGAATSGTAMTLGQGAAAAGKLANPVFNDAMDNRDITPKKKFSTGGDVSGPQGKDVIPAMLTDGEYVIKKDSVAKLGAPLLHILNESPEIFIQAITGGMNGPR